MPVTVLEANSRFIVTYKNTLVLSDREKIDDGHVIAKTCKVEPTTVEMIDTDPESEASAYIDKQY